MSEAKKAALEKAQAAALANLKHGSPRARGKDRADEAIEWIYKWGWSTPTILEINAGSFRSGLANRLVKTGFLNRIQTPSGGINSTPTFLLTLTQKGFEKAVEITDNLLPYETDPNRINFKNITHDELVQRLTAIRTWIDCEDGGIDSYITPKNLHAWNAAEIKIPDAVWKREDFLGEVENFAIEVELTPKFGHEFDRFVTMTIGLLSVKKEDGKPLFGGVEIFSKSPALLKNYSAALSAGQKTPIWQKEPGKTGRWKKQTDTKNQPVFVTASEAISRKIKFISITPEMITMPGRQIPIKAP